SLPISMGMATWTLLRSHFFPIMRDRRRRALFSWKTGAIFNSRLTHFRIVTAAGGWSWMQATWTVMGTWISCWALRIASLSEHLNLFWIAGKRTALRS